ncbi:gfo/Idh/MocA family oxidoreductase [Cryobacterium tepidiphilum]|uniref:Gfo/Idh/MocA family oxidoreductase n=2 Tax=Cryobacterium tepidiphilum TaxID=2486026 RepID=A0A3M8LF46_9MICO|nr:gfo/Idh/MocA family oxidoreductase [Cryobacterium tepidiphilum]
MSAAHAAAWSELGLGERIRYVCTPHPRPPLAGAPAARFVSELDDVLADDEVDILSVCTPTPSHAGIAIRALAAGKSVLLEKPIALTREDALAVARAAADSGATFMVAQVVRFFAGYRMLRASVEAGHLGSVRAVRASRRSVARASGSWLDDESASGGVLVDFAIHDFDQVNLFLGTPTAVTAARSGGTRGEIETTVEYAGGGVGRVVCCSEMPAGSPFSSSLEIEGVQGGDVLREEYRYSPDRASAADTTDSPYAAQAAYFLRCRQAGTPPDFCPTEAAIAALDVSLAARESLRTGGTVRIA